MGKANYQYFRPLSVNFKNKNSLKLILKKNVFIGPESESNNCNSKKYTIENR